MRKISRGILAVCLGVASSVVAPVAWAGPTEDGKAAYARGDYAEAIAAFRKGAEAGDALAANNLGFLLLSGQGVAKDEEEAARWFRVAAERGDASGQYNLAGLLVKARQPAEAAKWMHLAADQGHVAAQAVYGKMLLAGLGVDKDENQARAWLEKAASQGSEVAKRILENGK